jgi:hypothetical protein
MSAPQRGTWLTICAVCFALLAVSDLLKPLHIGENTGLVFFGTRLHGAQNAVLGPLFGVFLGIYAYGIWTMRRFAMAMGHAYATYVIINLVLWQANAPAADPLRVAGGIVYALVAIAVSLGAAVVLTKRKADLR